MNRAALDRGFGRRSGHNQAGRCGHRLTCAQVLRDASPGSAGLSIGRTDSRFVCTATRSKWQRMRTEPLTCWHRRLPRSGTDSCHTGRRVVTFDRPSFSLSSSLVLQAMPGWSKERRLGLILQLRLKLSCRGLWQSSTSLIVSAGGSHEGKSAKMSSLDEDGMVRPAEKVEDGFLLANKILKPCQFGSC